MLSGGDGDVYVWRGGSFDENIEDRFGADQRTWAGRVTYTPIFYVEQIVHLGVSVASRGISEHHIYEVEDRLGIHTATNSARFTHVGISSQTQFGLEIAWLNGPFSVQLDYLSSTAGSASQYVV